LGNLLRRDWRLYVLLAAPIVYFIIFKYFPMYGVLMAFQDYNMFQGVFHSKFVGFDVFKEMLASRDFLRALRNTFLLNFLDLLVGFPAPLLLAILLNELKGKLFKRFAQTVLYFPHFLSWVIIGGIAYELFATKGIVNNTLQAIGMNQLPFLTDKWYWLVNYVAIGVWQNAGWGTIIYLAAISGINTELYEASSMDGASRLRQIWHILLPGIRPTIVTLLILNLGKITAIGFDRPFVLQNTYVLDFGEVISTYVYKVGLQSGQFSFATAVGLFQSVIGMIFLLSGEYMARRLGERGIW
jgi:putative aldouronate transport system permease protein